MIRVDGNTGERTTVSSNQSPIGGPSFSTLAGIAVVPGGDILVTDLVSGVIRVDGKTGERTTVSSNESPSGEPNFVVPVGIAVAPGGH